MKLSVLLLLGAAMCMAQAVTPRQSAVPSPQQPPAATEYEALPIPSPAVQAAIARDMERAAQANCPVVLTSAWLAPRLQLLKSADASADGNGLDLEFRNASGKAIRSMELSATILIKKSIYDLGYLPPVHLQLTAFGTRNIDSAVDELRRLTLPSEMHPALVDSVRLEQVTFADGSVWSPKTDQYCGLTPDPMRSIAR